MHLFWGALTVATVYPFIRDSRRLWLKQRWSRQLLDILGIRLDTQLKGAAPGSLFVANHISWLDIYALNAARPMAFVSKAEVRGWPLIGWLAENTDTLFLRRDSRGHARVVNADIGKLLDANKDVAVFPEGTSSDGTQLLNFHGALLQPAIDTGRPIQPVVLSYFSANGQRSLAPVYAGEITMGECLGAILACKSLTVRVQPAPPLDPQTGNRRELAQAAHGAIAYTLGLPLTKHPGDILPEIKNGHPPESIPSDSPDPAPAM